jgi:cell division transport system permease protein
MKAWVSQHCLAAQSALLRAWRHPAEFLFNVMAIAIVAALPVMGLTLLENLRPVSEKVALAPEISIFLTPELPREKAKALAPSIQRLLEERKIPAELSFVGREQALASLRGKTNLAEAVAILGSNPLPDVYILRLPGLRQAADTAPVQELAVRLKSLPGVDFVQADSVWMQRVAAMLALARSALLLLAGVLSVVVVAVVFNTIRLQVFSRRDEIAVCRMLGATHAYLYRPFYYSGTLLGSCAGLLALGITWLLIYPLDSAVSEFAALYGASFRLGGPTIAASLLSIGVCAGLGWIGALLPLKRLLRSPVFADATA